MSTLPFEYDFDGVASAVRGLPFRAGNLQVLKSCVGSVLNGLWYESPWGLNWSVEKPVTSAWKSLRWPKLRVSLDLRLKTAHVAPWDWTEEDMREAILDHALTGQLKAPAAPGPKLTAEQRKRVHIPSKKLMAVKKHQPPTSQAGKELEAAIQEYREFLKKRAEAKTSK